MLQVQDIQRKVFRDITVLYPGETETSSLIGLMEAGLVQYVVQPLTPSDDWQRLGLAPTTKETPPKH